MPRRERSVSNAMKRLSRPISTIITELTRKPSEMFTQNPLLLGFDAKKALALDFETSKEIDFDLEKVLGQDFSPTEPVDFDECLFRDSTPSLDYSDDTPTTSPSNSIRRSSVSWHVKRDHGIYIYQDNAIMSSREAYNPFSV